MRYLPAARIVILDADTEHRQTIVAALTELGLTQLLQASDVVEAVVFGKESPVDLCVVNARGVASRADHEDGKMVSNPFGEDGTPAILLSADISGPAIERAYAAGYRAVVGLPVQPRVLYRRIGSILQMARHSGRNVGPDHVRAKPVV